MPAPTIKAIYDTRDGVVHLPDHYEYGSDGLEATDEFVAWLNTKATKTRGGQAQRFTVVTVAHIAKSGRGGMARQYTEYLKGEPDVRIRAALRRIVERGYGSVQNPASLVHRGGGWEIPHATATIKLIAEAANVAFAEAHAAFAAYLRHQLGDLMDRIPFPPADAVRPDDDNTDRYGNPTYPLDL